MRPDWPAIAAWLLIVAMCALFWLGIAWAIGRIP